MVVAAVLVFAFVRDVAVGVTRFTTGRPVDVGLDAGDDRTIYTRRGTTSGAGPFGPEPTCQVVDLATGAPVPTRPDGSFTLTLGDDEYSPVADFEAPHDGRYQLACAADSARPVQMALGPRIRVGRSVARILGAVTAGLLSLAAAAATIAVTAVKRHQARRRLQPPPPPPPPPPPFSRT